MGVLAAAGVSALLLASTLAYDVLRIVGAASLVWIGSRMLWSAIRRSGVAAAHLVDMRSDDSFLHGWRQGVLSNVLNPTMGAFSVALLPQRIPDVAPHLAWGVSLATVHVLLGTMWLTTLSLAAQRFRGRLARRCVARTIDGVAGGTVLAFGVGIALEGTTR